jgi:hypothetical protein
MHVHSLYSVPPIPTVHIQVVAVWRKDVLLRAPIKPHGDRVVSLKFQIFQIEEVSAASTYFRISRHRSNISIRSVTQNAPTNALKFLKGAGLSIMGQIN